MVGHARSGRLISQRAGRRPCADCVCVCVCISPISLRSDVNQLTHTILCVLVWFHVLLVLVCVCVMERNRSKSAHPDMFKWFGRDSTTKNAFFFMVV